ncbi:hypothetical protein FD722_15640 [Photobacterium damselae subsp. damselae]|uniref:hypothetical protein n=1 Tax=Photobacterium damselae TaxID=38293 RepID=UPI0010FDEF1F|nr:hypothetical protein [Photobacterium damselae]TLS81269.1 hypothetical protein FD719_15570 [Photobacterium damselae subsp. damselae]TLS87966.1 hypothetical protein FD722_15640 [Photobacterium damselae subsp. damselae]
MMGSLERTEFSDEIFGIFRRALAIATRFDSSTKSLARLPLLKQAFVAKAVVSEEYFNKLVEGISNRYKNLNRAVESLNLDSSIEDLLTKARESRNELIHESTLGHIEGFDSYTEEELNEFLRNVNDLTLNIIRGEAIVSAIISIQNNE